MALLYLRRNAAVVSTGDCSLPAMTDEKVREEFGQCKSRS